MKWIAGVLASLVILVACASKPKTPDISMPPVTPTITSKDYGPLDWAAWIGTATAVTFTLLSVWFPGSRMRATAGAGIGIAVGAWIMKFLLVKYLWIAVLLTFLVSIICSALFLWGHRLWFERKLNVDLTRNGEIGS